jgi:hypothetical protein
MLSKAILAGARLRQPDAGRGCPQIHSHPPAASSPWPRRPSFLRYDDYLAARVRAALRAAR